MGERECMEGWGGGGVAVGLEVGNGVGKEWNGIWKGGCGKG